VYPITLFLHPNEYKNGIDVDIIVTLDLADKYYFMALFEVLHTKHKFM